MSVMNIGADSLLRRRILTLVSLITIWMPVDSFVSSPVLHQPHSMTALGDFGSKNHAHYSQVSRLHVTADAAAMEEEMEKEKTDDDDWIKSEGGFIPKIGRNIKDRVLRTRGKIIHQVKTIDEYKDVVVDEESKLVCVRFHAPWCRACKAVAQPFLQLAKKYPDQVKFVEVPVTKENSYLHQGLGVPSLPYGHIYHPDVGLVEEMKMNKKVFADFNQALKTYVDGQCEIPLEDDFSEESSFQ